MYNSHEGLPGKWGLSDTSDTNLVTVPDFVPETDKKFPATRQPDGHFRDLFSCTILTKDFPETGSKLPGLPGFYSGRRRTRGDCIPVHLPAMNPNKALAVWMREEGAG